MKETRGTALVTGSGRRRVGNVVARSLAERGYAIALHYHSSTKAAEETAEELRMLDIECDAFRADVSDEAEVEEMFRKVKSRFGRLDVLVTTASIWGTQRLEDVNSEDLLKNFQINTVGTFLCARQAGLIMCAQAEGGSIITMGDWAIDRPYLDHAAYFISKGSIPTLTRTLAVELGMRNSNVRVNCIHPGPIMFPPDTSEKERQELIESTLTKSGNCPESVSQAVAFFIENKFVTGTCLPVDGGRSIYASEATSRSRAI